MWWTSICQYTVQQRALFGFWPSIWPARSTNRISNWLVICSFGVLGNSITSQKFLVVWKGLSDDDPNWRTDVWELKPPIRSKIGLAWWKGLQTCTLQMVLHVTCFNICNRKLIEKFVWDIKYYKTFFLKYIGTLLSPSFLGFLFSYVLSDCYRSPVQPC